MTGYGGWMWMVGFYSIFDTWLVVAWDMFQVFLQKQRDMLGYVGTATSISVGCCGLLCLEGSSEHLSRNSF